MGKEAIDVSGSTGHDDQGKVLPPWEQHASVISLPRYDYRTPSLLLESSHSGFLITCPIKREKSATKEAISILQKLCSPGVSVSPILEPESEVAVKRRKFEETTSTHGQISEPSSKKNSDLSLIKLARSGLILLTITVDQPISTVEVVLSIFCSLESGDLKQPIWCHRIFPIQKTCILKESELHMTVTNLFQHYLTNKGSKLEKPIKFAVGYNRRGLEHSKERAGLDRDQCFSVVAKAVKNLVPDAVVDLNSPQMAVLVEALPVSGLPPGSVLAGVSVLPHNLITAKPRLSVKALIAEGNSNKKKR